MTPPPLHNKTVVVVGVGGLGCPALWSLIDSGIGKLLLLDDDAVDESNLGRQILFGDADIGQPKLLAARARLLELGLERPRIELLGERLLPHNARELVRGADVVLEGADNYATKFLAADACRLEQTPIIHGAALQWRATMWAVGPNGRPCYRCLFEDLPAGETANCSSRGVMGPVVGVAGALMADLALGVLMGSPRYGTVFSYEGKSDRLRPTPLAARPGCALCGDDPSILNVEEQRYTRQICAA
jgi:molybdopterin/thiamine biosynthesis adenylyltransferase